MLSRGFSHLPFPGTQGVLLELGEVEANHPSKTLWVKGKGLRHGLTPSFAWQAQNRSMLLTATREPL